MLIVLIMCLTVFVKFSKYSSQLLKILAPCIVVCCSDRYGAYDGYGKDVYNHGYDRGYGHGYDGYGYGGRYGYDGYGKGFDGYGKGYGGYGRGYGGYGKGYY